MVSHKLRLQDIKKRGLRWFNRKYLRKQRGSGASYKSVQLLFQVTSTGCRSFCTHALTFGLQLLKFLKLAVKSGVLKQGKHLKHAGLTNPQ